MAQQSSFDATYVGMDLGTLELTVDAAAVAARVSAVQWGHPDLLERDCLAPPGTTIELHPRMRFERFPNLRAGIWAKSEHEFFKPLKIGTKVTIRGKVVDKYTKRGRYYVVSEYETTDGSGQLLMRSRETSVNVE